ncbi:MAG TPA: hypothetical protein VFI51_09485 [Bradyrhizobium sp.]|nr:hypothetical protein [Bradyrhizobium sp.]
MARFRSRPSPIGSATSAAARGADVNHRATPKSRRDATLQLFRRFPFRAFLAVFLLVFLAVVLAALLDLPAAVFLAGFAADFLTAFLARVFLRGLAVRLEAAARFRGGA